jgi:hypothetical protein
VSGSPQWLLQQAVYSRLSGDAALATMGAAVYDEVPQDAAYPYITLGDVTETSNDTMGRTGRDVTLTIHIWSQYPGSKQAKEVYGRLDELLDRWTPTVTGWNAVQMQQEFFESFRDPDGITRHGVARYRIHTHQ